MSASFLKRTRNNAFPSEIVEDQNIERSLKARPVCNRTSADCQAEAQFQHCSFAYEVLTSCDLQGMQMKPILSMAAFLGVMCQSHTEAGLLCPTPNQNPDQSGFTISTSLWDQHAGDANCHASSNQYILKALEPTVLHAPHTVCIDCKNGLTREVYGIRRARHCCTPCCNVCWTLIVHVHCMP
mmetsp:Transcript_100719/g.170312  ORF Transcript_100719/g.170312 Transcript_100719/m.170312 type:complete len:183 (+) Transcript_100719:1034-1582(+)